jgi:hypothetical protein
LSATTDLLDKARTAAFWLVEKGLPKLGVELSEAVGIARSEYWARERMRNRLAAYHEKRATECEGPTRQFHFDAAAFLRGES